MDLGCCVGVDQLPALEAAGDYCELSVARTVMAGDDEFARLRDLLAGSRLQPRAYNVFLPGDLKVVGPEVDRERIGHYVRAACERVGRLGGRIIVFGSGGAPSVPVGAPLGQPASQPGDVAPRDGWAAGGEAGTCVPRTLSA